MGVAGACLRQPGGHVYYVGAQLFGIVGFVDSSEMVSTFGSSRHEVRGFVEGGWEVCMNREGKRMCVCVCVCVWGGGGRR